MGKLSGILEYLGLFQKFPDCKQKYKDKERVRVLFYQTLRIGAMIIYIKFDPF